MQDETYKDGSNLSLPFKGAGRMKAMIFAAGLGTRFKPWTDKHPKALAVVNGKSLLQRNIEYLRQYGISEVVVNVHHFADQIVKAIEDNNGWGSHIIISDETEEVLETGGGLLRAKQYLHGATFITINADILTNANLDDFLATHQQEGATITLAVTDRKTQRYLLFDKHNRLCGWRNTDTQKEKISVPANEYVEKAYSGIAIFEPSVFDAITQTGKFSLVDVFLTVATHSKIAGFNHSTSKVIDVGRTESVALAESMFA